MTRRRAPAAAVPAEVELDRLVSLAEAAARLAVCVRTLERMIARRELVVVKVGHGRGVRRVRVSDLARIMAEGTGT
jgi:excisionase family DNA binding protein